MLSLLLANVSHQQRQYYEPAKKIIHLGNVIESFPIKGHCTAFVSLDYLVLVVDVFEHYYVSERCRLHIHQGVRSGLHLFLMDIWGWFPIVQMLINRAGGVLCRSICGRNMFGYWFGKLGFL